MEFRISGRNNTSRAFDEVRADMRRTGDALTPMGQKIDMVTSKLGMLPMLFKAALAGAGVEAARQFAGAVGDANNAVAVLYDQAKASNVSFEGFQALGYAAKQNRIEIDSLGQGLREMQDKAEEFATTGGGRAAEAFERLGYTATSLREALKDPIELFEDIIGKMGDLDKAAQIRLMGDIFGGGEGDAFLRLLDDGKAGLEQLQQTARDTGRVLGEDLGAAAVETRRRFDEFASSFDLWWKTVAVRAGEYATGVGDRMGVSGAPIKPGNAFINGVADPGLPMPIGSAIINGVVDPGLPAPPQYTSNIPVNDPREALYANMGGRGSAGYKPAERFYGTGSSGSTAATLKSATKEVEAFDLGITKATEHVDDLSLKLSTSLTDGVMSVWQAFRSGENVLDSVANQLMSVADQLLSQSIQGFFSQILGGSGWVQPGRLANSANLLNVGSFEGGGDTGDGARSGGLDGKGGFMAMLHPRETVVDHTRGGYASGGGGDVVNNFYIDAKGAEIGVEEKIARAIKTVVPGMIKNEAPAAVASAQRNGSF